MPISIMVNKWTSLMPLGGFAVELKKLPNGNKPLLEYLLSSLESTQDVKSSRKSSQ